MAIVDGLQKAVIQAMRVEVQPGSFTKIELTLVLPQFGIPENLNLAQFKTVDLSGIFDDTEVKKAIANVIQERVRGISLTDG